MFFTDYMEISIVKKTSLKIKSKNAVILTDPVDKTEADVILNMSHSILSQSSFDTLLLVQGPGEYEVKGVSIHGKGQSGSTVYTILADGMKVVILSSKDLDSIKDTEDVTAIIVKVEDKIEDAILSLSSSSLLIFYDKVDLVNLSADKVAKNSKVNLKKRDELTGSALILTSE